MDFIIDKVIGWAVGLFAGNGTVASIVVAFIIALRSNKGGIAEVKKLGVECWKLIREDWIVVKAVKVFVVSFARHVVDGNYSLEEREADVAIMVQPVERILTIVLTAIAIVVPADVLVKLGKWILAKRQG